MNMSTKIYKNDKIEINGGVYEGERALYNLHAANITSAIFKNGESPLKECSDISLVGSIFEWKYPLWYSKNITLTYTTLLEGARSGIWYTDNIRIENSVIQSPKTFRKSKGIYLKNVQLAHANETMWSCDGIELYNCTVAGDYFCLNSSNITAKDITIDGNYAFDHGKNITLENCRIISKDAFWNTENVTLKNCVIIGEYIGWNSKNLTLIDCTVSSNQGFCYIDNLFIRNTRLMNTDLCFELCTLDCEIIGDIVSVKNPISGRIVADNIGEIILDKDIVDPTATQIEVRKNNEV